ncbi:(2,3-dihydroxybenzoyl)adenylate synthase [Sandaracinus amylolyticus]|uniref:(2,3-dihydroxybenzoyl)adenylate synthase n=1 Tax=Sandaracinus amylolyticus TaxID=927083 RepID=UPI001F2D138F|nr:AMP-binding protein [Sandaracinus amylolyticus]UJR78708.1 Enterobactin synthase subunit E [Sandaracinus amylolyticus]
MSALLEGCVPWPDDVAERYRRVGHWRGEPLDRIVRAGATRHGDRVAVVCGERRVTYAELDARIDRMASSLFALGLRPLDRVVVQLPNVLELVETLFALWRLGAIPVMALPGHRRAEIAHFCEHTRAVAYVCADVVAGFDHRQLAREVKGRAGSTLRHLIVVGNAQELVPYASLDAAPRALPDVDARQVALLQLSGGSTGTPKLIPRTHDDYLYSVRASVPICGLDAQSVYLVALPGAHNFPLSSAGILGALAAGARVVMSREPHPDAVFPLIQREGVTITALVPPLARVWLAAMRTRGLRFPSLEVLQVGGAKLGAELARDLIEGFGCLLQQVFGMAEGLVCYTRLDDPLERVIATQGRPISEDDEVRIVDDDDRDVRDGAVGHLLARGPYTIRGYYRVPEHDAIAFTRDGFYRTGDRVRRTPDGSLVVEGRAKEQINRGGEKIAPAELEQHLAAHPDVREAAVLGLPDAIVGERICAVVVSDRAITRAALMAHLRERGVAVFKLPDRVELVSDALPRTSVGKIDKNALSQRLARGAAS